MPRKDPEERKAYQREVYHRNRKARLAKQAAKEKRRRRHLDYYKVKTGCVQCGFNAHPAALDFHHVDPATKVKGVPAMLSHALHNLFAEIRKCEVLCANCHRIEHFTQ